MAASVTSTPTLQAPIVLSVAGAAPATLHKITFTAGGRSQWFTFTTDSNGSAAIPVVPQGPGAATVTVTTEVTVATTTVLPSAG